ncbi:asparagine synthase (glutamine-hydrolysing) [Gammaproteobacteria bacterium]
MCGIAGALTIRDFTSYQQALSRMTRAIAHRGPDADGHWYDSEAGIALGHRRLSIIDLTEAGAQPMLSVSGRYVLVFNGEIYNHLKTRKQLEREQKAPAWRGHSDTETTLAAIEIWGLEKTLQASTGMFAIALWDRAERVLSLARDRIGEKPLYYGLQGGALLFASELKAIKQAPGFKGEINRDVLALYFQYNAVPDPYCIYHGLHKLQPGTILRISAEDVHKASLPEPQAYWSLVDICQRGLDNPFQGSAAEAVAELERLFAQSIAEQTIADVPLGAFLSGGVDSSAVVAMMQAQSSQRVKTFTIGFTEQGFNEAEYAKAVALHLGTEHHELMVSPQQAMAVIHNMARIFDEPFADNSQIPTFLVCKLARQHVTVSLSGDAGDELFGGYNSYRYARKIFQVKSQLPAWLWERAAAFIKSQPEQVWDRRLAWAGSLLPSQANGQRLHKLASLLSARSALAVFQGLNNQWPLESGLLAGSNPLITAYSPNFTGLPKGMNDANRMMALDILNYMPADILVKVDRAAMANSLETRMPLLDPRILEFSQSLPLAMKMRGGQGKWILRQLLYRRVPNTLIERPKTGFAIPLGAWLRGPLRSWGGALLSEQALAQSGLFNPQPVLQKWQQHQTGSHDWGTALWNILMLQAWLVENR